MALWAPPERLTCAVRDACDSWEPCGDTFRSAGEAPYEIRTRELPAAEQAVLPAEAAIVDAVSAALDDLDSGAGKV